MDILTLVGWWILAAVVLACCILGFERGIKR